jgi:hypothetical protein
MATSFGFSAESDTLYATGTIRDAAKSVAVSET